MKVVALDETKRVSVISCSYLFTEPSSHLTLLLKQSKRQKSMRWKPLRRAFEWYTGGQKLRIPEWDTATNVFKLGLKIKIQGEKPPLPYLIPLFSQPVDSPENDVVVKRRNVPCDSPPLGLILAFSAVQNAFSDFQMVIKRAGILNFRPLAYHSEAWKILYRLWRICLLLLSVNRGTVANVDSDSRNRISKNEVVEVVEHVELPTSMTCVTIEVRNASADVWRKL